MAGRFFCWKAKDGIYRLSAYEPQVENGDLVCFTYHVAFNAPEGMESMLPETGEVRHMLFHEELWGKAKELPSYDKKFWLKVQRQLGA